MKLHPRLAIPLGVVVLLLVGGTVVALNRDTSPSIIRCVDGVGDCPSSAPPTVPAAIRPPQSKEPTECDPAALDCPESSPTVVPEPPPVEGSPADLITQPVGSPEVISLLDRYGCTVPEGLYVPGGLIPSSGGFECRDAGVGITLDTDLNISGIGFYGEGLYGFSAYTGPLPFDLQFGASRIDVESTLDAQLGSPVTRVVPSEYDTPGTPFKDAYAVDGADFRALDLEFAAGTEGLQAVTIGVDKPWCISSCFDPNAP